jgi:hypothetical protein
VGYPEVPHTDTPRGRGPPRPRIHASLRPLPPSEGDPPTDLEDSHSGPRQRRGPRCESKRPGARGTDRRKKGARGQEGSQGREGPTPERDGQGGRGVGRRQHAFPHPIDTGGGGKRRRTTRKRRTRSSEARVRRLSSGECRYTLQRQPAQRQATATSRAAPQKCAQDRPPNSPPDRAPWCPLGSPVGVGPPRDPVEIPPANQEMFVTRLPVIRFCLNHNGFEYLFKPDLSSMVSGPQKKTYNCRYPSWGDPPGGVPGGSPGGTPRDPQQETTRRPPANFLDHPGIVMIYNEI